MVHPTLLRLCLGALLVVMAACSGGAITTTPAPAPATTRAAPVSPTTTAPAATTVAPAEPDEPVVLLAEEAVVRPFSDAKFTNPGAVIFDGDTYHMYRNSFSQYPGETTVTLLTSPDGLAWEEAEADPVFGTEFVDGAEGTVFMFSGYVADDGTWVGYYYTYDGELNQSVIGRATAPGPSGPWVADPIPALEPGSPGTWDDRRLAEPSVIAHDGRLFMYYTGFNSAENVGRIGLATSDDGITWTKHDDPTTTGPTFGESDPVLFPYRSWEQGSIGGPQVLATGEGLVMLYDLTDLSDFGIGVAVSNDGVAWQSMSAEPLIALADTPSSRRFYQHELIESLDGPVLLLEVFDEANVNTEIYPYAIDFDALGGGTPGVGLAATATTVDDEVVIEVIVTGFQVDFVPGDVSGATAHVHAYVDRPPPDAGDDVPLGDPTIVHSVGPIITLEGLESGRHEVWVVAADGNDRALIPPEPFELVVFVP